MNAYSWSKTSFWGHFINIIFSGAVISFVLAIYFVDKTLFTIKLSFLPYLVQFLSKNNNLDITVFVIAGFFGLSFLLNFLSLIIYRWTPIRYFSAFFGFFTSFLIFGLLTSIMIFWGEKEARENNVKLQQLINETKVKVSTRNN